MPSLRVLYKRVLRKVFEAGQHLGFDILPRHFYSEIPDIRVLRARPPGSCRSLDDGCSRVKHGNTTRLRPILPDAGDRRALPQR